MEDPFDGLTAELQTHYRNMQDDLYDGLTPKVVEATNQALAWGQSPANILAHGLVAGMDAVGKDFGAGILFVPEVLRAANAMKAAMEILRPLLVETGVPKVGTAVIGTVKGDIHDIGKNLVA
jgi:methanogenic corrinoid protein MtbC1